MRFLLLSALLLCFTEVYAQSAQKKIDSLLQVAETSTDSTRLRIYNKVSFYYIFNDPPAAKNLLQKGIQDAQETDIPFSEAELTNTLGIYFDVSGKQDSAKYYFEKALNISKRHDFKIITVMIVNNLGMFNWNKGNYQEALAYFFSALEMNKTNTTDEGNGTYLNNIGLIYQEMADYDKALEYHNQALEIRRRHQKLSAIPASLNNIGICHLQKNELEKAETFFKEAISTAQEANENGKYYDALVNLSNLYVKQKKYEKAIPGYEKAIAGRDQNNIDRNANVTPIANLILAYISLKNTERAEEYILKGEALLDEFPDTRNASVLFYRNASEAFFLTGNTAKGSEYLDKAITLSEEIYSAENAEAIANLETKFNVAEKEADLATTRANLAETELKVKQRNTMIYGALGLALILGLLGYLFYNQQKLKNRQLVKEGELQSALAQIETQNKLQEQRLRISRDLHDNIGSQLTFIISSIDSLQYGLAGSAPKTVEKLSGISAFTSETIYELRDTIWAMNKDDISFEDLQTRISNFIKKANTASEGVEFDFKIAEAISKAHTFTSVEGMNIYRIIQEAVNNALKHSEATTIEVLISENESTFIIEIKDNGKGFTPDEVAMGNGLGSIKKRAKEIGGELVILSEEKKGTNVIVKF
ncbi:tetratricopeptide repeat protein [Jejudonia soesokkakensis]|uniref:histidine kinase n=1 Tax=Jejudonia soesokkakensis TaxID=1323432 RepID=A0ABW2MPC4_9FLAO